MSEVNDHLFETIDRQNSRVRAHAPHAREDDRRGARLDGPARLATERRFGDGQDAPANSVTNITTVAATAEVLATIVNTLGPEKLGNRSTRSRAQHPRGRPAGEEPLRAADVQRRRRQAATKSIHVPDEVFSSPEALLTTLAVGDQVFINAYLLANTVFARQGNADGLEVRPLHGRDHGRRGRAPRARAAVARQARQRPRLREVRPARGGLGPAHDRRAGLLQDPRRRRRCSSPPASASASRAASRAQSTTTPRSPRARRPTPTSTRSRSPSQELAQAVR